MVNSNRTGDRFSYYFSMLLLEALYARLSLGYILSILFLIRHIYIHAGLQLR